MLIKSSILEFLGSIVIAFFGSIVRMNDKENFLAISITYFFMYSCLLYSYKGSSSAHFNPLVTISLLITKQTTFGKALVYVFVQLVGSIVGASLVQLFYIFPQNVEVFYCGEPELIENNKLVGAGLELIGMFILVWTYNSIYENINAPKHIQGIAIASIYLVSMASFGEISGGSLNLVSIFGPSIFSKNFMDWLFYFPAHILGGISSSLIYYLFLYGKSADMTEENINELSNKKVK